MFSFQLKNLNLISKIQQNFVTKKTIAKQITPIPKKKAPVKKIVAEEINEEEEVIQKAPQRIRASPIKKTILEDDYAEEDEVVKKTPIGKVKKAQGAVVKRQVKKQVEEELDEEEINEDEEVEILEVPVNKKQPSKNLKNSQNNESTIMPTQKKSANVKKAQQIKNPMLESLIKDHEVWAHSTDLNSTPEFIGKLPLDHNIKINTFPLSKKEDADPYNNYIASDRTSEEVRNLINQEKEFLCNNYAPLPIVIQKGRGPILEDKEGVKYVDCLSGYGAVNFGHSHPFITHFVMQQVTNLSLTSRALYTLLHSQAAGLLREIFGYEKILFMNSGVEGCEAAVKLARRYAYRVKNIPENKAKIVYMSGNFWGRSITACGTSDDPSRYTHYGPYDNHHYIVPYGDINKLTEVLNSDENICAVMAESIQGEAGFIIPPSEYIQAIRNLTRAKNILYIDDEVQSGMGRSGMKLAYEWHLNADKPDIVVLAKALSGGSYPVSAVMTSKSIMDLIGPGEHGGTFTGNPLGMSATIAALTYFKADNFSIVQRCNFTGAYLSYLLWKTNFKWLKEVRGRGMLIGLEFHDNIPISTPDLCLLLMEKGLITKNSHKYNLRVAPPININIMTATMIYEIFNSVFKNLEREFPSYVSPSPNIYTNFLRSEEMIKKAEEYLKERNEKPLKYEYYSEYQTKFIEKVKALPKEIKNIDSRNSIFLGGGSIDDNMLLKF